MCQVGASVVAVVVGDSTAAMAASSHFAEDRLEVGPRCAPAERPLLATTGPRALVCFMSGGSSRGRAGSNRADRPPPGVRAPAAPRPARLLLRLADQRARPPP